jgi:hypothetical protein
MESQFEDDILLGYESVGPTQHSSFIQGSRGDSFLGKDVQGREYIRFLRKRVQWRALFNKFVNPRNDLRPTFLDQLNKHRRSSATDKELLLHC